MLHGNGASGAPSPPVGLYSVETEMSENSTFPEPHPDAYDAAIEDDFDLESWIAGVQPTTKAVLLYGRADLIADMDEVERKLRIARESEKGHADAPMGAPDEVEQLQGELEDLLDALQRSGVMFRVQGRSDAWRQEIHDRIEKEAKRSRLYTRDQIDEEIALAQLAGAVTAPAGITIDHLKKLQNVSEAQVKMLLVAFQMACVAPPVSAPKSQLPSGRTGGRTA